MTPIHVVGIGLDGLAGLTDSVQQIVNRATLLVGSDRHLSYFPDHAGDRLVLGDFLEAIRAIQDYLQEAGGKGQAFEELETATQGLKLKTQASIPSPALTSVSFPAPLVVILTSGDPLFFGLGRLLLAELAPDQITFHPHLSSIQLAFSRVKVPWQDARVISAHGRSLDELTQALQQGVEKIAVLTDRINTPQAIARLLLGLDLPVQYRLWVCENLGGVDEQVQCFHPESLINQRFAPLNVVILLRDLDRMTALKGQHLPALGLPDHSFLSFSDRPGLMTKREIRLLVLGELGLQPDQVIWDIGAGTGSVSIEIARLFPSSRIYAVEKSTAGATLIQKNSDRFQVKNVISVHGAAPAALQPLPTPDRIFIGGSGGQLIEILEWCSQALSSEGSLVLALATLEHLTMALHWLKEHSSEQWQHRLLQVQLARSIPVSTLTRWAPLNPVTLLTLMRRSPEQR